MATSIPYIVMIINYNQFSFRSYLNSQYLYW